MFTDESPVNPFVIVGEKVPKTGYGDKPTGETGFQRPIRAENFEHLGIRLWRPEFYALYQQLTENDAAFGQEVQVMKKGASIDLVRFETFVTLALDRPEKRQALPDPAYFVSDPFLQYPTAIFL